MSLVDSKLSELASIYQASINAGITQLCEIGAWPRPSSARILNIGYDFYYDDINKIPEADTFVQRLADDKRIRDIYFTDTSNPEFHVLYYYWIRLLLFVLQETDGNSPSKRVLSKWLKRFLKELYSDTAIWRTVETVTGLKLNGKRLEFDVTTALSSIPGYSLEYTIGNKTAYSRKDMIFGHQWAPGGHDKASIITTKEVNKHDYAGSHRPHQHLTDDLNRALAAIEAIRLSKPGTPRLHYYAQFQISKFPLDDFFSFRHSYGNPGLYEAETVIEKGDYKEIKGLWRELMESKYKGSLGPSKPTPLDVALGRFSKTYELQSWLDHIVDLTIALESLFGPKEPQELRHRISLRAAWLLGQEELGEESSWSDANVLKCVRTMYDIRSARVHGGIPKDSDIHKWLTILSGIQYDESQHSDSLSGGLVEKSMEAARQIVRRAIKACLRLAKGQYSEPCWPLPDNFDEKILSKKQRGRWQLAAGIRYKSKNKTS